jgi:hypothetical protein
VFYAGRPGTTGVAPLASNGVVQLSGGEKSGGVFAPDNQNLTIRKKRGSMKRAGDIQSSRGRPSARCLRLA